MLKRWKNRSTTRPYAFRLFGSAFLFLASILSLRPEARHTANSSLKSRSSSLCLNIDLSLIGFYTLAPLLFVIFHVYVLVQVLLLARTAAVYNEAVERTFPATSDRTRVRQRLANTLFAQIFAGSPESVKACSVHCSG
jgi:hypothetical protein